MPNEIEDTIFSEGYEIIFDETETPEQIAAKTAQELEDNGTISDNTVDNSAETNEQFFEETEENIDNSSLSDALHLAWHYSPGYTLCKNA